MECQIPSDWRDVSDIRQVPVSLRRCVSCLGCPHVIVAVPGTSIQSLFDLFISYCVFLPFYRITKNAGKVQMDKC